MEFGPIKTDPFDLIGNFLESFMHVKFLCFRFLTIKPKFKNILRAEKVTLFWSQFEVKISYLVQTNFYFFCTNHASLSSKAAKQIF